MTDITCIGEVLIDLTQTGTNAHGVPQFSANPGGAPAKVFFTHCGSDACDAAIRFARAYTGR